MSSQLSRRQLLAAGAKGGAALSAWSLFSNRLVERRSRPGRAAAGLGDINHIVILIQENRCVRSLLRQLQGVAGFQDPNALALGDGSGLSIFAQPGYPGGFDGGHLYPFHMARPRAASASTTSTAAGAAAPPTGTAARWTSSSPGTSPRTAPERPAGDGLPRARTCRSTTRSPTLTRSATTTTARCLGRPTRTAATRCQRRSAERHPPGGPNISTLGSTRLQTYGKYSPGRRCPRSCRRPDRWKVYDRPEN